MISMFEQYGQNVNMASGALLPGVDLASGPIEGEPGPVERSTFQIDLENKIKKKDKRIKK